LAQAAYCRPLSHSQNPLHKAPFSENTMGFQGTQMPASSLAGPFLKMQPAAGTAENCVVTNPTLAEGILSALRLLTLFSYYCTAF